MKLTDLTQDQLRAASIELGLARCHYVALAFGPFEQFYRDQAAKLEAVICVLDDARVGGDSDGI